MLSHSLGRGDIPDVQGPENRPPSLSEKGTAKALTRLSLFYLLR